MDKIIIDNWPGESIHPGPERGLRVLSQVPAELPRTPDTARAEILNLEYKMKVLRRSAVNMRCFTLSRSRYFRSEISCPSVSWIKSNGKTSENVLTYPDALLYAGIVLEGAAGVQQQLVYLFRTIITTSWTQVSMCTTTLFRPKAWIKQVQDRTGVAQHF